MLDKMWLRSILILISIFCLNTNGNLGSLNLSKPKKISNCEAELDDKTIVDLSSLNNKNNPKYK